MPLQQVHLRINDAATGKPTPVRLRVTDAAGNYYPPHGHSADFPTSVGEDVGGNLLLDGKKWAYIDGSCEIALPPGELTIEASKGPEYKPLHETIQLPPGKLALRFSIERWTNQRDEGWYSGDTRAHYLSPHAALLEAAAEDLAVVNLLARKEMVLGQDGQTHESYPNLLAFSGQKPCLERDGHLVVVNTHNTHPVLGKLGLLHCHRIVYPLTFGGPDATDDWSLDDWCGQCHRKRGLVVWTDAFNPKVGHAGEALAALILGHVDAIELDPNHSERLRAWYQLLNAGIRVPIVAASAKVSNRRALGAYRTYARVENQPFSYTAWIEAIRAGATFVTARPAVFTLDVDGTFLGQIARNDGRTRHAMATISGFNLPVPAAQARDIAGVGSLAGAAGSQEIAAKFPALNCSDRLELVINGSVEATSQFGTIGYDFDRPSGGWVAARCWAGEKLVAHTSPVYVLPERGLPFVNPAAVECLDSHLARARHWVETEGRFENPKSRERLLGIFNAACKRVSEASRTDSKPLQ